MGKEVQREERWRHANRCSNKENGRRNSKKTEVIATSQKIFPPFVWSLAIRWRIHNLYNYSVTAQRVYSDLSLRTRLLILIGVLLCFKSTMSSSLFPHFLFLSCWCSQVSCSDIDLCVVKQINLSARICVRKENKRWSKQMREQMRHVCQLCLFSSRAEIDLLEIFLVQCFLYMDDVALGTLSVYLCPEQEENTLFLQGSNDGRQEKGDCSGK